MRLHSVDPKTLSPEIFRVFGTQNALLTAGDQTACNTMTIGWCQIGRLWNLPVCTVYVRPERYTYAFTESHDYFTVSILPATEKKTMGFCGTKSGRDVNKIKECGLTVCYGAGDAPFFDEAELVLVCRNAVKLGHFIKPFYHIGNNLGSLLKVSINQADEVALCVLNACIHCSFLAEIA